MSEWLCAPSLRREIAEVLLCILSVYAFIIVGLLASGLLKLW